MNLIGRTAEGHAIVVISTPMAVEVIERLNRVGEDCQRLAELLNVDQPQPVVEVTPPVQVPAAKAKKQARKYVKAAAENQSKACEVCGKHFVPPRKDSRLCSKACMDKAYRAKKHVVNTPKGKVMQPANPTKPTAAATGTKVCQDCQKPYKPTSNAQQRCEACGKAKRMETLRKLVKKDAYVPPEVRQASGSSLEDISEVKQAQREARFE